MHGRKERKAGGRKDEMVNIREEAQRKEGRKGGYKGNDGKRKEYIERIEDKKQKRGRLKIYEGTT